MAQESVSEAIARITANVLPTINTVPQEIAAKQDADKEWEQTSKMVGKTLSAQGMVRPAEQETKTPNSATPQAIARVNEIMERAADELFLCNLCHSLMAERLILEEEIDTWRKRCDDYVVQEVSRTLRGRPVSFRR